MESHGSSRNRSRDLIAFFFLAYAFSWLVGIPLALSSRGIIGPLLPEWTHYLYAYGPMFAALLVTGLSEGREGLKDLGSRMFKWRVRPIWWIVAISPLLIGLGAAIILNVVTSADIRLDSLGEVNFLPPIGIAALFLWILTYGIGEETGWRGYALPRLQSGRSALMATTILWALWAPWHLPVFFYLFDPSIAVGWLIGLFAGAILFTWLINSTAGSILIVAVWHGCFNFLTSSEGGSTTLAAVVSTIVMVWAVAVVVILRPTNLSRMERFTR